MRPIASSRKQCTAGSGVSEAGRTASPPVREHRSGAEGKYSRLCHLYNVPLVLHSKLWHESLACEMAGGGGMGRGRQTESWPWRLRGGSWCLLPRCAPACPTPSPDPGKQLHCRNCNSIHRYHGFPRLCDVPTSRTAPNARRVNNVSLRCVHDVKKCQRLVCAWPVQALGTKSPGNHGAQLCLCGDSCKEHFVHRPYKISLWQAPGLTWWPPAVPDRARWVAV